MNSLPGDIVLYRSQSIIGRLIRRFSRHPGEGPTHYNHVGVMISTTEVAESKRQVVVGPLAKSIAENAVLIVRRRDVTAQVNKSIPPTEITFTDHKYKPRFNGKEVVCKAAAISQGGTAGVLEVHLLGDPVDRWWLMPLGNDGKPTGAGFDRVRDTNSTVTISEVTLFPE